MGDWNLTFDRAHEHIEQLDVEIKRFLQDNPYGIRLDVKSEPGYAVAKAFKRLEPPEHLSSLIGDAVQNLRSSLDQLVYALSRDASGNVVPGTEFPVFTSEDDFDRREKKGIPARGSGIYKMRALGSAEQDIVRRVQPYHRGDDATLDRLWILHDTAVIHRHRHLHLTGAIIGQIGLGIIAMDNVNLHLIHQRGGAFDDGQEVARYLLTVVGPNPRLNAHFNSAMDVAFSPAGPFGGKIVVRALSELSDMVEDLIAELEVFVK